jgi:pimeloyl-ACP methyl ester carboxylesterase
VLDVAGAARWFFSTADTVEDLDALRRALKAPRIALDGTSYGTYVAQRYALAHPDSVSRLILDSVVPVEGVNLLATDQIRAAERVQAHEPFPTYRCSCWPARSTSRPPLEWAQRAAQRAPRGRLVVVDDAGHAVQGQKDPDMLATLRAFAGALAG